MSDNEVDFHGWYPEDAVAEMHIMVGDARILGIPTTLTFITGNGRIKQLILAECEKCGILCKEQIGNRGALVAYVE